jgi:hypothetical protein
MRQVGWYISALMLSAVIGCASAPAHVEVPPVQPPAPKVLDAKAQKIELILQRADTALAMQALTEPVSENAYDLYRAVLIMDPTNIRGQEGIKNVAAAFPAQVEEAIVGKQYDAALRKLQKGLIIFPADQRLKQMQSQVKAAKLARMQAAAKSTTIMLSTAELTAKTPAIEEILRNLAKRAAENNEMVIINARNDAEGRWIYKTMKASVGARLHGDIKISSSPSVQVTPVIP